MRTLKTKLILILALSAALGVGCATVRTSEDLFRQAEQIKQQAGHSEEEQPSSAVTWTLPEYEKLSYRANYMGINVGTMTAAIVGLTTIKGRPAYRCEVTARTNAFFSKVFHVDDRLVSYMDAEKLHVLRQEIYRREGKYKKDSIVEFDHDKGKAYYKHLLDGTEEVIDIPYGVQDAVTANYYLRIVHWQVGDALDFKVYIDEKIYDTIGLVKKKVYLRVSGLGKQEAFMFQPYAKHKGELVEKGNAVGYFHTNPDKKPLRGIVNTPIFGKAAISFVSAEYGER